VRGGKQEDIMSIWKRKLKVTPEEILKARKVSMTDLLLRLGFTWKEGQSRIALLSPLRKETTPSFFVFKNTNTWFDFGADEGGDTIKFVMRLKDCEFQEAVKTLCHGKFSTCDVQKSSSEELKNERIAKIAEANALYAAAKETTDELFVRRFFKEKGVRYYPEIRPVTLHYHGETYIAIPCPFPERVQSLECRSLSGERKTFGRKIPWLLKRDTGEFLITESILDGLAGDVYFGRPSLSLCALNGIPNVKWLDQIVDTYSPGKMLLALDNDPAGKEGTEKAKEILKGKKVKIEMVKDHINAGVKDLHKLLTAEPGLMKKKRAFTIPVP
jgi:hypothetical protein